LQHDSEDDDDEELLNLRFDALASAYYRNAEIVKDNNADAGEKHSDGSHKKEKPRKKKVKQKVKVSIESSNGFYFDVCIP